MSDWLYPDAVVETEWLEARFEDESVGLRMHDLFAI